MPVADAMGRGRVIGDSRSASSPFARFSPHFRRKRDEPAHARNVIENREKREKRERRKVFEGENTHPLGQGIIFRKHPISRF
jgi:hypothetical protein